MASGFVSTAPAKTTERPPIAAVDALSLRPEDVVVAVSASGATPFTLAGARRAKEAGACVAAIVCRPGSPLAGLADVAATFDIGAEAVEGSTRLAAGTAQKAALGVISTLAAAELGHVHDGLMINVRPENVKLRARARNIVERLGSSAARRRTRPSMRPAAKWRSPSWPRPARSTRDLGPAHSRRMRRRSRPGAPAPPGERTTVNASAGMRPALIRRRG